MSGCRILLYGGKEKERWEDDKGILHFLVWSDSSGSGDRWNNNSSCVWMCGRRTMPKQKRREDVHWARSASTESVASSRCRAPSGTVKRRRTASRRSRGRRWGSGTHTTRTRRRARRKTSPNSPASRRLRSATGSRTDVNATVPLRARTAGTLYVITEWTGN